MGKNILITGGAGFIGLSLAKKLKVEGNSIAILDNFSPQIHKTQSVNRFIEELKADFKVYVGDVQDKDLMKLALTGIEVVYHLASETGTGQSMYEIQKYCQTNVLGTAVLLECIQESKIVEHVILSSSRSVYGEGKYFSKEYGFVYPNSRSKIALKKGMYNPSYKDDYDLEVKATDEDSRLSPISIYAATKLDQENLVSCVCNSLGIKYTILRFQNVYGPGQSLDNPYTGILSIFSKRIIHKKTLLVFEDGEESRDFIFIDDLIEILSECLYLKEKADNIINVGTGVSTSILTVAKTLLKVFDSDLNAEITGNYRLGDIRHNFADTTRMYSNFKFRPKYTFEQGAIKFKKWVEQQEVNEDQLEISLEELKTKGLLK